MKNLFTTIFVLVIFINIAFAQGFHGQATYFSKLIIDEAKIKDIKLPAGSQSDFAQALKKANEKTFILNFNQHESAYEQEQILQKPTVGTKGFSLTVTTSAELSALYKNTKINQILQEQESMNGKKFLVSDSLIIFKWDISGETKKIGIYNCLKATAIIKVTPEQIENYNIQLKQQANKPSAFFTAQPPKDEEITAWFTTEIPVNHGPGKYWGLPGLILEIISGKTIILCSKVVINPKNKNEIKVPSKGKNITKKEYDAMQKKMFDSMKNEDGVIIHETRSEK